MGIIRILLAVSVVLHHSSALFGFSFVGGIIAVQAFYIISGFYMSLILNEKYVGANSSYKLFITNRLLRLYPIYWVVLALTIFYSLYLFVSSGGGNWGNFNIYREYFEQMKLGSIAFLVFTNLLLFLQDMVMFLGLDSNGGLFFTSNFRESSPPLHNFLFIPQAWTIGVEIAFYIIAPFLVKRKIAIIIPIILLCLGLRWVLFYRYHLDFDPWTYRFFPTELVFFLLGILSYRLYKKLQTVSLPKNCTKLIWLSLVGFTVFYNFLPIPAKTYVYLIGFFMALPFVFILTKNWKTDTYIGELSYPIYIAHFFVLTIITALKIPVKEHLGLLLTISTIILSIVLNELVSKRIEKIRQKRIKPIS